MSSIFEVEQLQAQYNLPARKIYELHARFQAATSGILDALLRSCAPTADAPPSFPAFVQQYVYVPSPILASRRPAVHQWLLLLGHQDSLNAAALQSLLAPYATDPALLALQTKDILPTPESTALTASAFAAYVTTRRPVAGLAEALTLPTDA
ncbi:hypothetical protein ACHHYP_20201 [Achlya hypogyna]|uniref:Uncharacterized protein n=1 Tax=Achlya hypogyna TaxID=1202772 RepID=A0A1V9YYY2_ACHHY|nr:hypothetical protein ACHHYP_20201 [Achlya hypogyna]